MAFRFDHSGSLNILKDGQPFLSGISISLHRENGEKIPLSFSSADTHRAFFEGDLWQKGFLKRIVGFIFFFNALI